MLLKWNCNLVQMLSLKFDSFEEFVVYLQKGVDLRKEWLFTNEKTRVGISRESYTMVMCLMSQKIQQNKKFLK